VSSDERPSDAHGDPPGRRVRKRPLLRFALVLAGLVATAMAGGIGLQLAGHLPSVEALMDTARPWFIATQFALTALLWLRWRALITWLVSTSRLSQVAAQSLLQARHRLVAFILLIQLTVVLGLPFSLFDIAGP
jgi:hypothetical protein